MNYLLISSHYSDIKAPTPKIIQKILKSVLKEEDKLIIISEENISKSKILINGNVTNYQIPDYGSKMSNNCFFVTKMIFKKIRTKFTSWFLPRDFVSVNRLKKHALKMVNSVSFDRVIAFAGLFSNFEVAYQISKKYNKDLVIYYCDPFFNHPLYEKYNRKKLESYEIRWLKKAAKIGMPSNYYRYYQEKYPEFENKIKTIELPCIFNDTEVDTIKSFQRKDYFLHVGSFVESIREPGVVFRLMEEIGKTNNSYKLISLGNFPIKLQKKYNIPANVYFEKRAESIELLKKIGEASCLVLIDNKHGCQIPSKAFEYVSSNKPILFFKQQAKSDTLLFLEKNYKKYVVIKSEQDIDSTICNKINQLINDSSENFLEKRYNLDEIFNCFSRLLKD